MNITDLVELLLSSEEQKEMQASIQLLENKNYRAFYEKNQEIVRSILFIEDMDEFLDFSSGSHLDMECFCFAFLCTRTPNCAKKHGIQIGGYEDDLTDTLTAFFHTTGFGYPEIFEMIGREKIYTDCDDGDNFKKSMEEMNKILGVHGLKILVFEDSVYCACEYTILAIDKSLADKLAASWESDNFAIYL